MIEKPGIDLHEALILIRAIRMETRNRMGQLAGMEQGEGEMSLLGSKIRMMCLRHQGIGKAMETNLLTEVEAGEKRTVRINQVTVAGREAMTREIVSGTGIDARSVILNGWTSERTRRKKNILWKISKSGKREWMLVMGTCGPKMYYLRTIRMRLEARLLSVIWRNQKVSLQRSLILVQTSSSACGLGLLQN
jgi:hypothetical protein